MVKKRSLRLVMANISSKRLIIVSGSFPDIPCGVSPHTARIAGMLSERNSYDVHVLTSADSRINPDVVDGYQLHPVIRRWGVVNARGICRAILSLKPSVVNIQNPSIKYRRWNSLTMSVVVPLLKKMAPRLPVVLMQHDIAVGGARWRYRPLLRAADAVLVSNSRDEQAVLAQSVPAEHIYRAPVSSHIPVRSVCVGNDEANSVRADLRKSFGIADGSCCVMHFGFIHPDRNIHIMLQSLARLRDSGIDVCGLVVGSAPPEQKRYYRYCQRLANRLNLQSRVIWTGFADENTVVDCLIAADVFVSLLSRGADMRNSSIITAMLAQLPVITTINPKYYEDRDLAELGCVMVPPRDVDAVARAINDLRSHKPDTERLGAVSQLLSPERVWAKHIDIILQACERASQCCKKVAQ